MKTNTVNEIKTLAGESIRLKKFINVKLPQIIDDYKNRRNKIDKHRDGFNEGDAIQSFYIRLSYQSFTGTYGDSSVYSDFIPNNEVMSKYFLVYLNRHTKEIFNEMAEMMLEDARSKRAEALKELDDAKQELDVLLSNTEK
jgi:hypothetical protein